MSSKPSSPRRRFDLLLLAPLLFGLLLLLVSEQLLLAPSVESPEEGSASFASVSTEAEYPPTLRSSELADYESVAVARASPDGQISVEFGGELSRRLEEAESLANVEIEQLGFRTQIPTDTEAEQSFQLPADTGPGIYRMRIQSGVHAFETPLTVLPPTPPSRIKPTFRLEAYKVRTFEAGAGQPLFCIPIFATAWQTRGATEEPFAVQHEVVLDVRDLERVGPPFEVKIPPGKATSDEFCQPALPGDLLRLQAYAEGFEPTPAIEVGWAHQGPKLELVAAAPNGAQLAGQSTPVHIDVWIREDDHQWQPPREVELKAGVDDGKVIVTAASLSLLGSKTARIDLRSTTSTGTELRLSVPELALKSFVPIEFRYPVGYLMASTLSALIGIVVARRAKLFQQAWWAVAIEMTVALGAGYLTYMALVNGWVPAVLNYLGYSAAIGIGVVGGYLGEGVFHSFAALFRRFLPVPD